MNKQGMRRIISLLLAVMMVCTLLPTAAFAEGTAESEPVQQNEAPGGVEETPAPAKEGEVPAAPEGEDGKKDEVQQPEGEDGKKGEVQQPEGEKSQEPAKDETPANEANGIATYASNSTVVLHPSVGSTVTGVKVSVGGTINGYTITSISGYDITVDLGKYNVNNGIFRLPYAKDIWSGVDNNKVDYISWAGSGSTRCSEGASALLANGKNTAYYYFKGAPVLLLFMLNYDANGGTGAPASQTYKATSEYEKSHSFTISSQVPTREGYTFLGWSTDRNAAAASYQPGGSIFVTGTTTLYAVWEENTPPTPDKPDAPNDGDLGGRIGEIAVNCINEAATHTPKSKGYALIPGSYTVGSVAGDADSGYTYTVTINAQKYVEQFDTETGKDHDPKDGSATVTLVYTDNGWTVSSGAPVNFNVQCVTEIVPSAGPSDEELANLEAPVEVVCTTKPDKHNAATFALREGTYEIGEVTGNNTDGYSCDITVTADEYVALYNTDFGKHTLTGDNSKPLTLKYVEGRWVVNDPVTFPVECETAPEKPTPPTDEIGGATVAVKCITGHGDLSWKIGSSTFTVGEVTGDDTTGYTCTVTVQAEVYVNAFNSNKKANGVKHTLADDAEKTFTMTYVNGAWTGPTNPAVTFEVKCEEELVPVQVVIYRNGDTTTPYKTVSLGKQPKGTVLDLTALNIGDYYTANYTGKYDFYGWYNDGGWNDYKNNTANPPAGLTEIKVNGWTNIKCMVYDYEKVVYFQSAEALAAYQGDHSKTEGLLYSTTVRKGDTLPTVDAPAATRAGYTFLFWSREGQTGDVTGQTVDGWTNLYANWEKNTYTVTYTDGVDGEEVFADQVYTAEFEDATPAFEGTPTREGYVFDGWNPEVAETVTESVTYVATWKELFPVEVVIYRNGDTTKAYKTISLGKQPKDTVIDLTALNIADYYTANYTGKYDFCGWYNDGRWNDYKKDLTKPLAGLTEIKVNGWTNIICMVYDYEKVVYFQSAEALAAYQGDHSKTEGLLYSTTVRKGSELPTADAPAAARAGYHFLFWSREGQTGDVTGQTVNGWTNLYANWEKNTYTVTYTDGVDGEEVFADQVYTAKFEDATPAFEGTPTRKGFVFDGWNPKVAETVTDNAIYTAQWKPVQPDKKAIEGAIGRGVRIVCDNQNVNHWGKDYKPTVGEYTVSDVMGTAADGYTCTVTVKAAKFIEKYNSDMDDAVHTLIAGEPAEKTIELKWNGEKWVAETELPVTFHTLCPPEQPSKKDIEGAIGRGVRIVCDNQNVNHWAKDYKPTQGEYTVSDVTGTASEGYTCTITVKAAKIVEKYSNDFGKTHDLIVGEAAEKTVELKWDGEKWVAKTELPITFHVECPPEKPTYDDLKELGIDAKVHCATTTAHNDKSYTLIEGTYDISDPERKGTAYTCILTVNAKDYVAKYNTEEKVGPHTLDDRDSKTIELTWNGEKWTAAETSVTFNVKCELLTVTYTDGVKGEEVFADVVYKDIPYGTSTPAFGTKDPTRKGYVFAGWNPTVAETVTANATYVATWKVDANNNGIPDDEEEKYTVIYTDGVNGAAFADQVYEGLLSGDVTPRFNGTPTRKGYTFNGWSPKVANNVTKSVTYTATWKAVSSSVKDGKDSVAKTGDSGIVLVLGGVMLFSLCGAVAVSVYDRKRKQG